MGQEEAQVPVCGLGLFGQAVLARLRPFGVPRRAMPSAGTVVAAGDQSVVPASLPALRRIELGRIRPPAWEIAFQLPDPHGVDQALPLGRCWRVRWGWPQRRWPH